MFNILGLYCLFLSLSLSDFSNIYFYNDIDPITLDGFLQSMVHMKGYQRIINH